MLVLFSPPQWVWCGLRDAFYICIKLLCMAMHFLDGLMRVCGGKSEGEVDLGVSWEDTKWVFCPSKERQMDIKSLQSLVLAYE